MGLVPVAGQTGGADLGADQGGVDLQGLGVAAVEAGALPGEQIVDDRLTGEGVPEAVARAVLRGHEGVAADGRPQRLDEIVLGHPADGGEEFVFDGGAALGGRAHHPLGVLGQRLDTDQQQIAQWVAEAVQRAVGEAAGQFLDEEGVALGALVDPVDGVLFRSAAFDPGDLGADLLAVEAGQLDAPDRTHPVDLGEEGPQRVAAVDVVRAVRRHQEDVGVVQCSQEVGEQFAGGAVGPVEVLDDEDEGAVGGEPLQEAGGQLEEAGAPGLLVMGLSRGLPQFGQDAGEFALLARDGGGQLVAQMPVEGVQDRGERGEGQSFGADLDAAAERHEGAPGARGLAELLDEAGLSDPCLTSDQQRLGLAGHRDAIECLPQHGEFGRAADEHGTDGPGLHVAEHRTGV